MSFFKTQKQRLALECATSGCPRAETEADWHQGWTERMQLDPAPVCHRKASDDFCPHPSPRRASVWGQSNSEGQEDSGSKQDLTVGGVGR